jgi:hypothetical protein
MPRALLVPPQDRTVHPRRPSRRSYRGYPNPRWLHKHIQGCQYSRRQRCRRPNRPAQARACRCQFQFRGHLFQKHQRISAPRYRHDWSHHTDARAVTGDQDSVLNPFFNSNRIAQADCLQTVSISWYPFGRIPVISRERLILPGALATTAFFISGFLR